MSTPICPFCNNKEAITFNGQKSFEYSSHYVYNCEGHKNRVELIVNFADKLIQIKLYS